MNVDVISRISFERMLHNIEKILLLNINKPKTKDVHVVRYCSTQAAAHLLAALKFAEFPNHISIDYGLVFRKLRVPLPSGTQGFS